MQCQPEMLSLYNDGELSPRDTAKVENHLSQCPACRNLLGAIKEADSLLYPGFKELGNDLGANAPTFPALLESALKGLSQPGVSSLNTQHIFLAIALLAPGAAILYLIGVFILNNISLFSLWGAFLDVVVWVVNGGLGRLSERILDPVQNAAWLSFMFLFALTFIRTARHRLGFLYNKNGGG